MSSPALCLFDRNSNVFAIFQSWVGADNFPLKNLNLKVEGAELITFLDFSKKSARLNFFKLIQRVLKSISNLDF